jgi:branched-subunit amino acid transport protein
MNWLLGLTIASSGTYALRVVAITMLRGRTLSVRVESTVRAAALGVMAALAVSSASNAGTTTSPWAATIGIAMAAGIARWTRSMTLVIAAGVGTAWAVSLH